MDPNHILPWAAHEAVRISFLQISFGKERQFVKVIYAMNILWDMDIYPALDYIVSKRTDGFDTREAAVEKFALIYNTTPEERERLERYAEEHMHQQETPDGVQWVFDHARVTKWAFISWDK